MSKPVEQHENKFIHIPKALVVGLIQCAVYIPLILLGFVLLAFWLTYPFFGSVPSSYVTTEEVFQWAYYAFPILGVCVVLAYSMVFLFVEAVMSALGINVFIKELI